MQTRSPVLLNDLVVTTCPLASVHNAATIIPAGAPGYVVSLVAGGMAEVEFWEHDTRVVDTRALEVIESPEPGEPLTEVIFDLVGKLYLDIQRLEAELAAYGAYQPQLARPRLAHPYGRTVDEVTFERVTPELAAELEREGWLCPERNEDGPQTWIRLRPDRSNGR